MQFLITTPMGSQGHSPGKGEPRSGLSYHGSGTRPLSIPWCPRTVHPVSPSSFQLQRDWKGSLVFNSVTFQSHIVLRGIKKYSKTDTDLSKLLSLPKIIELYTSNGFMLLYINCAWIKLTFTNILIKKVKHDLESFNQRRNKVEKETFANERVQPLGGVTMACFLSYLKNQEVTLLWFFFNFIFFIIFFNFL